VDWLCIMLWDPGNQYYCNKWHPYSKVNVIHAVLHVGAPAYGKASNRESIEEAPAYAGLLVQQYPCRAVRGTAGGIHKAAQLHKKAVEKHWREVIYERDHI